MTSAPMTASAHSLIRAMWRLWTDHVVWTRDYIMTSTARRPDPIAGLPSAVRTPAGEHVPAGVFAAVGPALGEADTAAARLLKNQEDIGHAIVPYYGEEAGEKLTGMLKQHIMIAVDLIEAAKADDQAKFKEYDDKWTANVGEIAEFLAGANPNWGARDLNDLLLQHLILTKAEVTARLRNDWAADVDAFDQVLTEILTVSDALSDGIIKQFPEKFEGGAQWQRAS